MKVALLDFETKGHHLKYAGELADYLQKKGGEVMFITKEADERVKQLGEKYPRLLVRTVGRRKSAGNFFSRRFREIEDISRAFKIAKDWQADIFHFLYLDSLLAIYLLSFRRWPFRIFGTTFWLLSLTGSSAQDNLSLRLSKRINRIILKKLVGRGVIKRVFCQHIYPEKFKEEVIKQLRWIKKFSGKFSFLHDPIYDDFSSFCSKEEARKKMEIPSDKTVLLFFGALTKSKGLDILLEALKDVKREVWLIIAGHPHSFTPAEIAGYKVGNSHRVVAQLYFIPEQDVPYYFMAADVVLMPYRREGYAMGTSGVLMQACSARKPVICSDIDTLGALVRERGLGMTVEPGSVSSLVKTIDIFLDKKEEITQKAETAAKAYFSYAWWPGIAEKIYLSYQC